ncbi:sulfite exporter TauE/SafE family protein [Aquabacterium parvum]|uniref:sulfite exporter TauE/SafE family protein n=1 Tax=Aquabacterium parvum TaxID=70584 RepID=UPI000718FF15|nr:sulfite exporter TauE/SafE family protein [Aquabacterium parvum]MBU0917701.1 sulfite exporter TauE/SafE family protein [Gammaproteobacteria bacterium]
MLTNLLVTAFLMGLAGIPHCTAMCGAACAAAFPRGVSAWTLLGRAMGYACLGVVAATAAGLVSRWGQQVAMIKPLWMMAQLAMVLLGGFMLLRGVIPERVDQAGKGLYLRLRASWQARSAGWPQGVRKVWPLLAGLAWALLPCGLLYSALMVAALASQPWEGGLVMLVFALPSALGVWAAPAMLRWLKGRGRQGELASAGAPVPVIWMRAEGSVGEGAAAMRVPAPAVLKPAEVRPPDGASTWSAPAWLDQQLAVRIAGFGLASMAAWGLWHQLWAQWQAWCA